MNDDPRQGTRLGDNELILRIGRGGMATVWVARERLASRGRDRLVAVKAMLGELASEPEFVRMFIDEVRLVRSIRHPNVVDVYDVGETQGVMWMSMEWVEGESLHALIAEAGKRRAIPPEIAVRIIRDVAAGMHAAHESRDSNGELRGVVHRDISPHNILIGTNGVVKLVDFGVAKALGRVADATRAGQLKGKFGYMSPEQALGKSVDRRSDVFSLGIVLFELTTSRRLFRGDSDVETLKLVVSGQVPPPSSIDPAYPPALERVVMKALERDPSARYQTAAEFSQDLSALLSAQRVVVPESGIAALVKRVVGDRIEQRRRAIRAALKMLAEANAVEWQGDPAFTPTGREAPASAPSQPTQPTPSHAGPPLLAASAPSSRGSRRQRSDRVSLPAVLGYTVGVAGLAIAVIVLLFLGR